MIESYLVDFYHGHCMFPWMVQPTESALYAELEPIRDDSVGEKMICWYATRQETRDRLVSGVVISFEASLQYL